MEQLRIEAEKRNLVYAKNINNDYNLTGLVEIKKGNVLPTVYCYCTEEVAKEILDFHAQQSKERDVNANFLSRQPQLSDFVPCGEDGLPLEKPSEHLENRSLYYQELEAYQQALDKVLFKGFEIRELSRNFKVVINTELDCQVFASKFNEPFYLCNEFSTLESLTPYNLELTDNGKNIINGNL